ncbi:HEAT repeat domain-containing protein [Corallococcus aberystwythensis]|uniref:HEAT repeat domain-containing protein n=1 Tax=Corallococcus aberystwythensis TaxID=2316722 RepID=A0A3A8PQM5_9BACT|nr:HEAT repeat domain-containing protein [Corallococcus aberystwythensis]RKH58757.1 HEAT repeat domain-containing protein [Corallococcus aberystwythensis]
MTSTTAKQHPLSLSADDRARVEEVEQLARQGPVSLPVLVDGLDAPSWAVRRAVVSALARLGTPSVEPLCDVLRHRRDNEARIAAAVDALVAATGEVEGPVEVLGDDPNPAIVCDAAQVLGRRRSRRSVPLLSRLIVHPDDNVAVAAIEALGRVGGGAAVDALLSSLGSGNFFRIFPAIDVLGRSGDPTVVPALMALLSDPFYVLEAARALGRTGQEASVPALVGLLQRGNDAVVRVAAVALVEIHDAQVQRFGGARMVPSVLRSTSSEPHPTGRRLAQVIAGADAGEKTAVARLLGWVGGADAATGLLKLLDSQDLGVSRAAAAALGELGAEADAQILQALREGDSSRRRVLLPLVGKRSAAVPDVLLCLEDRDATVRALAAETLSRIGDTSAVPALFARLSDEDPRVSQAVVGAIQSLGSDTTENLALEAARSTDSRQRRAALRIVAYFGYPRGLDALLLAMRDPDERLRDAAIYGLPFIDDPRAVDALLAAASHESERTRATAMRALGQTDKQARITSTLLGGLNDRDPWVRYYACQSLGKLNEEAAADAIVALANDDAGQVRVAVVDALAHMHTESAMAALRRAASSSDADVRRAALLGLGVARRPDALPVLLEAVHSDDPATRLVALSAVAEYDAPETLPALLRAAGDRDDSVRSAAVGFLATRTGTHATQQLVSLLGDVMLREQVVSALALPVEGRLPGLMAALEVADDATAPLLVAALARMRRADARAALMQSLIGASPSGRRAAAPAVAALGTVEAREALDRAAHRDEDPEVRRACLLALGR